MYLKRTLDMSDKCIWIESQNAWYKLLEPDSTKKFLFNGKKTTQFVVHMPIRAACSLTANILDMMDEFDFDKQSYFRTIHADKTPHQIHESLCYGDFEPFDFELLKREVQFVRHFVQNCYRNYLKKECIFFQGMLELQNHLLRSKKSKESWTSRDIDYEKSAVASEARGKRNMCGSSLLRTNERNGTFYQRVLVKTFIFIKNNFFNVHVNF